jgi:hypothetical protein
MSTVIVSNNWRGRLVSHKVFFIADDDIGVRIPCFGADKAKLNQDVMLRQSVQNCDVLRVRVTPRVTQ